MQCLCNHATDFSASSSKPKLKPISVAELTSVTLDDLLNAWMVFAVVGGMFGGTFFLAAIFEKRDGRARRAVLRKFVDPDTAPEKFGFAVVADVWTWNIDVQEMQFMYNNLHMPNTDADVARIMRQQVGTDDEVGRCRLTVSKPDLKARLVSAISA